MSSNTEISTAFHENTEIIDSFSHAVILQFLYKQTAQFDVVFLTSQLILLKKQHLLTISHLLVGIMQYRGISPHLITDVKVHFLKLSLSCRNLQQPSPPHTHISLIQQIITQINVIITSDECFENFIDKFPKDKDSLTHEISSQSSNGLHILHYFLLSLFSTYDFYTIQDLQSSLIAFNIRITIPIQWKIAIEIALNNLHTLPSLAKHIVHTVEE